MSEFMYETLDEVVDKTRPFSMFYSGVETFDYLQLCIDMGIKNFLMSYHYLKGMKSETIEKYKELGIKFFIDSGAFTYMGNEEYHDKSIEYWENQVIEYLDWCRTHRDMVFTLANLDLEYLVGVEAVQKWNKKYFEPFMLETGIPVCFIWHDILGEEGWEKYCQRYPFVGFSWVTTKGDLNLDKGQQMLRVAEKHNSVVHGMGMTRTALLPKLPFYTVDSTTWLAGARYGEVNYWRGTKMSRLKKDDWKGEYLPKLLALGDVDKEKLLAEDVLEMLKVNIIAFIQAEEYIITKLRHRMYWLKAEVNKVNSIEELDFPPFDFIISDIIDNEETLKWCEKFNINGDLNISFEILQDMYAFLMWETDNEEIQEWLDEHYEDLESYHDKYINKVVGSDEKRLSDLIKFFTNCAMGRDNTLLVLGTTFMRQAQEREEYLEDDDYEVHEVSKEELINELASSGMLPPPSEDSIAPEIDDLDSEIFSDLSITPVRDEQGRFLKGQKLIRKPKKVYSDKFPKMFCDTCYSAQSCPEYKAGMVCAFKKMFNKFDTRDTEDVLDAMNDMVQMNLARLQRATMFEIMEGGLPTNTVTSLIDQNMRLLKEVNNINANIQQTQDFIKQVKTVKADGTVETTTQVTNSGKGSGILEKLFSDFSSSAEDEKEPEDIMTVKEQLDQEDIIEVEIVESKDNRLDNGKG